MANLSLTVLLKGNGFERLGGVARQAMEQASAQANARLATQLVEILNTAENALNNAVAQVRTIRKQEKIALGVLKRIKDGKEYLEQTGNPLPFFAATGDSHGAQQFCRAVGVALPDTDDNLWKISKVAPDGGSVSEDDATE